jgi:ABC-2 type transport system permease protein
LTDLRLVLIQARYQLASIARNRRAVIFSLVFPVVLLVMFNSVFARGDGAVELAGAQVSPQAYFTGGMLAYAILLAGFSQLAISLVSQRESGQLKRLRGTPVPAWTFIGATVLRAVATVGLMAVVLLAIARLAYGVEISPWALAGIAIYVVLGTATMCSVGIAATAMASDVDSASAGLPLTAVVLSLISGIFVPVDQLPGWLDHVARIFPVYHVAAGLQTALGAGGGLDARNVAVLAAWGIWGIVFAARQFRWEPQAAAARAIDREGGDPHRGLIRRREPAVRASNGGLR